MKRSPSNSFKLVTIHLDGLRYGQNARRIPDPAATARLAVSMRVDGLLHPVTVTESKDGRFTLVAGFRRVEAALLNGCKEIRAVVLASSQSPLLNLVENIQREPLNFPDEALAIFKLVSSGKVRQADVALSLGRNKSTISRLTNFGKLVERYGDKVSWTKLKLSVYWELLKTPELIPRAEAGNWDQNEAREQARRNKRNADQESLPLPPGSLPTPGKAKRQRRVKPLTNAALQTFEPVIQYDDGFTIQEFTFSAKQHVDRELVIEKLTDLQSQLDHFVARLRYDWAETPSNTASLESPMIGESNNAQQTISAW